MLEHHVSLLVTSFIFMRAFSTWDSSLQQASTSSFMPHRCEHMENGFCKLTERSEAPSRTSCPNPSGTHSAVLHQPSHLLGSTPRDSLPWMAVPFPDLGTYPVTGLDFVSHLGHKIGSAASLPCFTVTEYCPSHTSPGPETTSRQGRNLE